MSQVIHNIYGIPELSALARIPGVEIIEKGTLFSQKLVALNEAWIRDQVVTYEGTLYETLNPLRRPIYLLSSFLRERGGLTVQDRYIPFQGGHIVQADQHTFCSSSAALNALERYNSCLLSRRVSWPRESWQSFKGKESSETLKKKFPKIHVLPSIDPWPWSFHADLMIAYVGARKVLLGDPSFSRLLSEDEREALDWIDGLVQSLGFEVIRFPIFHSNVDNKYHSPLNGLMIDGAFYFPLIEGMDHFNSQVLQCIGRFSGLSFVPIYFPAQLYGLGGGLRCLSCEWAKE